MMHCPYCKSPAHAKSSRYMSEQVRERYHQCTNLDCSCTFKTHETSLKSLPASLSRNCTTWSQSHRVRRKLSSVMVHPSGHINS